MALVTLSNILYCFTMSFKTTAKIDHDDIWDNKGLNSNIKYPKPAKLEFRSSDF